MFHRLSRFVVLAFLLASVCGCSTIAYKETISGVPGPRNIVVFFDGTHNDEVSDTNVKKLHSLVTLQDRPDISTLYIEGVGTGSDVAGMGAGLGMAARVRLAYEFLLQHYDAQRGDRIWLVGFSRGAYGARILNSLLYHAGLPRKPAGLTYTELAEIVFASVDDHKPYPEPAPEFPPGTPEEVSLPQLRAFQERSFRAEQGRRALVHARLDAHGLEQTLPVPVHVLALWDSVAAMGIPDWAGRTAHKLHASRFRADIDNPYTRYGDKLCNVEHAFQALSIDDDREWIFTPLPLTRRYLVAGCTREESVHGFQRKLPFDPPTQENHRLVEVWFAGAHSDVGGGYKDTLLSGVTLNWMMDRLREVDPPAKGIVPAGAKVRADPFGTSHDPEAGGWSPLYHAINRDLAGFVLGRTLFENENLWTHGTPPVLCVHPAVFERRGMAPPMPNENRQLFLRKAGRACLLRQENPPDYDQRDRYRQVEFEADGSCNGADHAVLEVKAFPCFPEPAQ